MNFWVNNQFSPETNGARVDEMAKEEEELSSFTPKSPISKPYIPDELNDPTAYPEILTAFEDAQAKYEAKLRKPLPQSLCSSDSHCMCLVSKLYDSDL
jgi:hypothetical protein